MIKAPKFINFTQHPSISNYTFFDSLINIDPVLPVASTISNPQDVLPENDNVTTEYYESFDSRIYTSNMVYQTLEVPPVSLAQAYTIFSYSFYTGYAPSNVNAFNLPYIRGPISAIKVILQLINISNSLLNNPSFTLEFLDRVKYTHNSSQYINTLTSVSKGTITQKLKLGGSDPYPAFNLSGTWPTLDRVIDNEGGSETSSTGEIVTLRKYEIKNSFYLNDHYFIKTFVTFF